MSRTESKIHRRKKLLIGGAVAAFVIIAGTAAFLWPFFKSSVPEQKTVYIHPGMTDPEFSDSLTAKFGEAYADRILFLHRLRPIPIDRRDGAYRIEAGTSPISVYRKLFNGIQSPVKFTFNNIRTLEEFAEKVSKSLCITSEEMLRCLTDSATCRQFGFNRQTIPAMLMPDTYEFYWTASPETVLKKTHENYARFWNSTRTAQAEKLGLTPTEVAILASIVEEETANSAEKGTIARLYMNRLERGMKLQSDPTVKFAVGDTRLRRILNKHLEVKSPYNTYQVEGLPPGPIRMPEKATLNAVLNAPENDYLYMCAKEDFSGTHHFTASYSKHLQNARNYQNALNKRGIK